MKFLKIFLLIIPLIRSDTDGGNSDNICFNQFGCFERDGGVSSKKERPLTVYPLKPEKIQTAMWFYHERDNHQIIPLLKVGLDEFQTNIQHFDPEKHSKIIVHAFVQNLHVGWAQQTREYFQEYFDFNIFMLDWHRASVSPYYQAVANADLVAVQLSMFIKQLEKEFPSFTRHNVDIITFSLSTHLSGKTGQLLPGIGRLTAMDPAGLYYNRVAKPARLDETDADIVHVVHTDAGKVEKMKFGTNQEFGDQDVYPNGGYEQPGCKKVGIRLLSGIWGLLKSNRTWQEDTFTCSHTRSVRFYTEGLLNMGKAKEQLEIKNREWIFKSNIQQPQCLMRAYACRSYEAFLEGECLSCDEPRKCIYLGFTPEPPSQSKSRSKRFLKFVKNWWKKKKSRKNTSHRNDFMVMKKLPKNYKNQSYFLQTNKNSPYCLYHYQLRVNSNNLKKMKKLKAMISIKLIMEDDRENDKDDDWIDVSEGDKSIKPSETITALLTKRKRLTVREIHLRYFTFTSRFSFSYSYKWSFSSIELFDGLLQTSINYVNDEKWQKLHHYTYVFTRQ
ncbi:hypothetical protein SNEBB_005689 [Seison nebaliae]|nr:hypothetical protein SNEBB_005689 [Seison nebaliae]